MTLRDLMIDHFADAEYEGGEPKAWTRKAHKKAVACINSAIAERDMLKAKLERVKTEIQNWNEHDHARRWDQNKIQAALEGKEQGDE